MILFTDDIVFYIEKKKNLRFQIFENVKTKFYWILISYPFFLALPLLPVINFMERPVALLASYRDEYVSISPVSKSRISTFFGLFRIDLKYSYFGSISRLAGASCFFTESSFIIPLSRSTAIISGLFILE